MSRPLKNHNAKKTRQIIFRVSEDDYIPLRDIAARAGMKPNRLARLLVLQGGKTVTFSTGGTADPALLRQLDHIGHNLNQLVRNAHIYKGVSPRVEGLCEDIRRIIHTAVDDVDDEEADE